MKYDEVISIGGSCDCKAIINTFNLSKNNFPLDWLLVNDSNLLLKAIDNDFKFLFDNVETIPKYASDSKKYNIRDVMYKLSSIHDVSHNGEKILDIEKIKLTSDYKIFIEKIKRRIHRWKTIIYDESKRVLILRIDVHKIIKPEILNEIFNVLKMKNKNIIFHYLYNKNLTNYLSKIDNNILKIPITKIKWGMWNTDEYYLDYINKYHS